MPYLPTLLALWSALRPDLSYRGLITQMHHIAEGRLEEMETGLSAMLAEIVSMEERKQALLEELNELDQRLFKAKSKWVRKRSLKPWVICCNGAQPYRCIA